MSDSLGTTDRPLPTPHTKEKTGGSTVCENSSPLFYELPISRPHKMSLSQEVKRIASEFELPAKDVNHAVKEFMRQMGRYIGSKGSKIEFTEFLVYR